MNCDTKPMGMISKRVFRGQGKTCVIKWTAVIVDQLHVLIKDSH